MEDEIRRQQIIIELLENTALSTLNLVAKLDQINISVTEKTVQRDLKGIGSFLPLSKSGRNYYFKINPEYIKSISAYLQLFFAQSDLRNLTYGEINANAIARNLIHLKRPFHFIRELIGSIQNSRTITFHYTPQHERTAESLASVRHIFPITTPKGTIPVTHLPRFLIFSPEHFLVSGESYFKDSPNPSFRHYEIKGIPEFQVGQSQQAVLQIDLKEQYAHSLKIWQGGEVYELTLEEKVPGKPEEPKIHNVKVRGEEEILSYVAASLGKIKIINPPDAIKKQAQRFELSENMFIYR